MQEKLSNSTLTPVIVWMLVNHYSILILTVQNQQLDKQKNSNQKNKSKNNRLKNNNQNHKKNNNQNQNQHNQNQPNKLQRPLILLKSTQVHLSKENKQDNLCQDLDKELPKD